MGKSLGWQCLGEQFLVEVSSPMREEVRHETPLPFTLTYALPLYRCLTLQYLKNKVLYIIPNSLRREILSLLILISLSWNIIPSITRYENFFLRLDRVWPSHWCLWDIGRLSNLLMSVKKRTQSTAWRVLGYIPIILESCPHSKDVHLSTVRLLHPTQISHISLPESSPGLGQNTNKFQVALLRTFSYPKWKTLFYSTRRKWLEVWN